MHMRHGTTMEKEFGKQDNRGMDSMKWINREKDWFNAERRHIYALQTPLERDEIIDLIKKQPRLRNKSNKTKKKVP